MDLKQKILEHMKTAKPWQRVRTQIEGIFLVKAPVKNDQEQIMIEINPLDAEGKPIKRRGLFLTNSDQLKAFRKVLNNDKALEVLEAIETERKAPAEIEI